MKTIQSRGPTADLSWQKKELVNMKTDLKRVSNLN